MKKIFLPFFSMLILFSCGKPDSKDVNKIDDPKQFYMNYYPDLVVYDSTLIDIDNNGINDIMLKINQYGRRVDRINDSIELSIGIFAGSGSGNLDPITYNELIAENSQVWFDGFHLFTQEINYIGVRKHNNSHFTYGWIKLELFQSSMIIDSHYFRKMPDKEIRAGIYVYE